MRKLLLVTGMAFSVSALFAQKIDDVKKDVAGGKYAEAKTKLDVFLNDPKNASNAEGQFYKAVVYHNLAKQNGDSAAAAASLEAFKNYAKMEESKPDAQRMLLSTLENHKTMVDIYQTYFSRGVEQFQKNTYSSAYGNFAKALDAFEMLKKQNLTTAAFDTTATLYAGYSAQNAQMYSQAAKHYDVIINNNIQDTTYIPVYRFMINSNLERKDTAAAKKYLGISQTRFPQYSDVWLDYQTMFLSNDKSKRFGEYNALVKANPKNETLAMNYAIELYNHMRADPTSEKDPAMRQQAEDALKNVLAIDPNNVTGNLLIAQFYWTELYQLQSELDAQKGATPAVTAKKKEINGKMDAVFDKVFPYLTKSNELYSALTTLKPQDKANYRILLGQLADYHNRKKNPAKAAEYQAKAKTLQ
jgi:hypothetical protein